MTITELKARLPVGAVFTCVENTYRPELNGGRRLVVKAQTDGIFWRQLVSTGTTDISAESKSWTPFPKARDIVKSDEDTVTFKLGVDDHTLTLDLP